MDIIATFPGGKRVDANFGGFTVHTDQAKAHGGDGSAPEPFDLFLASIASCAGIYVLGFCQTRGIPTDDVRVVQRSESDPTSGMLRSVEIEVQLPATFPEKYREAIARAAAYCKVKKTINAPPTFTVTTCLNAGIAARS